MKKITAKNLSFAFLIFFVFNAFSPALAKDYDQNFKKNYKKYKDYSPGKKTRIKNKWSSFKKGSGWNELSPEQKKRLREKVLKKAKKN